MAGKGMTYTVTSKILICGDRNWSNAQVIHARMDKLPEDVIVITGGADGADRIAFFYASAVLGVPTKVFNADWRSYGRAAGPMRNKAMLDEQPDLVIAFHNDIEKSKGTKNCLGQAKNRGIKTELISEPIYPVEEG